MSLEESIRITEYSCDMNPDLVTGLPCGSEFFPMLQDHLDEITGNWVILDILVENYKVFLEWFGADAAKELLLGIADLLREVEDETGGAAAYLGREDFCLVMPYDADCIRNLYYRVSELIFAASGMDGFYPVIGVAHIDGFRNHILEYFNRAGLTLEAMKGSGSHIKVYDAELYDKSHNEFSIAFGFRDALERGEICFWLQPQVRVSNRKIVGAESLARWITSDGTFISPADFIPVLEKYNLVTELDKYIWDSVCRWIRGRKDSGKTVVPVSINISQIDMTVLDLPEYFEHLLDRFRLTPKDIKIEVTETVIAKDPGIVHETVSRLREIGFTVMMDDFGSGYSSLNMLHSVNVDVIKLDAHFLRMRQEEMNKGIGILESIMNMTTKIATPIIVEGVESEQQMKFLSDYGVRYMQGFYFHKPMPVDRFEELIEDPDQVENNGLVFKYNQQIRARELFDQNVYSDSMLNSILGPVAFYRWKDDNVDIVRFNEQFYELIGVPVEKLNDRLYGIQNFVYEEDRERLFGLLREAYEHPVLGARAVIRAYRPNGVLVWMSLMVFPVSEDEDGKLFYVAASDVSDLQLIFTGFPGGYYRSSMTDDFDFLYISDNMLELTGFTRREIKDIYDNKLINMVHPRDRSLLIEQAHAYIEGELQVFQPYRIARKRGDYIYVADQSYISDKYGALCWQSILIDVHEVMHMRNQMILLTHHLKSTILFLRRVDGHLEYEVAINGLGKVLGFDADELRSSLNSGEFCRHIEGSKDIPHHQYTEHFIREIEGKQKKITYFRDDGTSIDILVRADRVDEAITTIEYIVDMDLAEDEEN